MRIIGTTQVMSMVRRLMVMIMCHCLMVALDAQHRKLCYSFRSINQIQWWLNQSWRQKKAMVLKVLWSAMISHPCQKPTTSRTWYQEQQGRVKPEISLHMLMTAHWTNSWLNLHWQQEAVHTIQRKEKHIVWTQVFPKGMKIPTSMKKMSQYKTYATGMTILQR